VLPAGIDLNEADDVTGVCSACVDNFSAKGDGELFNYLGFCEASNGLGFNVDTQT